MHMDTQCLLEKGQCDCPRIMGKGFPICKKIKKLEAVERILSVDGVKVFNKGVVRVSF